MTRRRANPVSPKQRRRRGDRWTYSYGLKPYKVFAYERPERGNQVYVRWTNLSKPDLRRKGEHRRENQSLEVVVRDSEGRLDERLVRAAQMAVQQFQARLVTGAIPTSPAEKAKEALPARPTSDTLTLLEGFTLALDPVRGKYPSIETRRYEQMIKFDERLFGKKPGQRPLINPGLTWRELKLRDVRALWRSMADEYVRTDGRSFGVRAAEQVVDSIYSVATWLREESRIALDAARRPDGWRRRFKEEWESRTGEQLGRPFRPRHTEEEFREIFKALSNPKVDPRIRLAIELAAECRTGQVLRCTRRMLELKAAAPADYENLPAGSLGQVTIPGAGKKHGEIVVLTPEQRRAVDDALRGYLANYEREWLEGSIEDYWLFPGSKMRALDETGRRFPRRVRADAKPLTRDGAREKFLELEAIAKVDHIPGRGWYGLRRQAADMAETATNDDRVKDRLGGWQDSETRKTIYQDRQTDELRAQAASVRRQLRTGKGLSIASRSPLNSSEDNGDRDENLAAAASSELLDSIWRSLPLEERRSLLQKLNGSEASKSR